MDYQAVCLAVYDIHTLAEKQSATVYPSKICDSCRRKLDKLKVKLEANVAVGKVMPPQFCAHSEGCSICIPSLSKKKVPAKTVFVKKDTTEKLKGCGYVDLPGDDSTYAYVGKVVNEDGVVRIKQQVKVNDEGYWQLYVCGREVPIEQCAALQHIPQQLTLSSIDLFVKAVTSVVTCVGNPDFVSLFEDSRKEIGKKFLDVSGNSVAWLEDEHMSRIEDAVIVRHHNCDLVVAEDSTRCAACVKYRNKLRVRRSRDQSPEAALPVGHSSHVRNDYLSNQQLIQKLEQAQAKKRQLSAQLTSLKRRVQQLIEVEGVAVDEESHQYLRGLVAEKAPEFVQDSPQAFLWEQQVKQAGCSNSRSMRWHPLMIRWCLSIHLASPAAYRQIRESGFLKLPHYNTLSQYINFTTPTAGFNPDILEQLVVESNIAELEDFQKNVSILFDEMKIKSGLVFSRSSGPLVGFTELGDINEEIDLFARKCVAEAESAEKELATHVIVFMVRGIFTRLAYPVAYFSSTGFTADQLYPCVWDAVTVLESLGFMVRAFVSDGASPNRKFYKICQTMDVPEGIDNSYWSVNLCAADRKIFFICDVPHLMKTTRNNWENSHGNRNTRNLHYEKQDISWNHLVSCYEQDLGQGDAAGLRKLHHLTHEHIFLTPRLRMRVNYAAQVLGKRVQHALESQGKHYTVATQKFIGYMDRFFDCLNASKIGASKRDKPDRRPYFSVDDERLQWLQDEFLANFIDSWEHDADETPNLSLSERSKLCLSKQTLAGLRITVKSFVDICRLLLPLPGVKYMLSEKLNQDPLEEYFAKQRRRGGCNENPTVEEFGRNTLAINQASSQMIRGLVGTNTRGRNVDASERTLDFEDTRLPAKKRRK